MTQQNNSHKMRFAERSRLGETNTHFAGDYFRTISLCFCLYCMQDCALITGWRVLIRFFAGFFGGGSEVRAATRARTSKGKSWRGSFYIPTHVAMGLRHGWGTRAFCGWGRNDVVRGMR